jgi:hypothetical protein
VVVGGGGAAGQGELAHGHRRGRLHVLGGQPRPHRVQRGQPAEQGAVEGPAAGHPLEEVVVGVDQPGGDDVAVDPHDLVAGLGGHRPDSCDPSTVHRHVPGPACSPQYQPTH